MAKDNDNSEQDLHKVLIDLEERVETQDQELEDLRKNEILFRAITEQSREGIAISDSRGLITLANQTLSHLTGCNENEILGKSVSELFQLKEGTNWKKPPCEIDFIKKDGKKQWIEVSVSPLTLPGSTKDLTLCIVRDITERKLAEETLRTSEKRLKEAQTISGMGSFRCDLNGDQMWWSDEMFRIFGFDSKFSPKYQDLLDRIHTDERPLITAGFEKARDEATTFQLEHRIVKTDGIIRYCRIEIRPKFDSVGHCFGLTGTVQDVTQRKKIEEERLAIEAQFQQAQKFESLGVMAGGIAHEFNNLLVGILGNAELALMDIESDSPALSSITGIQNAATRAAELVRQMLAYSGKGRFVIKPVRFDNLTEEMLNLIKASIPKKVKVNCEFKEKFPAIEGDPSQIRQMLMNLVTNASDAIGEDKGEVFIRGGSLECDHEYLRQGCLDDDLPEGNYCFIEVEDTGSGIRPSVLPRIFDPFFSTRFTGRGLGLAAVLGIVRSHHGTIMVDTMLDQGSTFRVLIPAMADLPKSERESLTETTLSLRGEGIVLLVDDEKAVRSVGRQMLRKLGFQVLTASDGWQALEIFRKSPYNIRCILLDLTMPNMDGKECFQELRKIRPDIPIILSSGYNEQELALRFGHESTQSFIQKPYKFSMLVSKLREVLQKDFEV